MANAKSARVVEHHGPIAAAYLWDQDNPHGYANRIGRYRTSVESKFLLDHIAKPPQRILDMGGGSGRFGSELAARGHHVTLIDRNPQAVEIAKKRGVQQAIACDITDFQERDFDSVVCMEVLQYFENCDTIISKADHCLKEGGTFIFCSTNSQSWRFWLRRMKNDASTVHAFTLQEIGRCLESHQFEVIACKGFQWSIAQTGSDSLFVDASIWIEKALGLQNWLSQSPWLLYACRKSPRTIA